MKAADLFVAALEAEGVKYIFGLPGEENLDLIESLRKSDIRFIVTRHEQAAGFMAATYGRLTGKPGVCLATLGPGATNLATAAAYAQLGAMPMVMITGQKPLSNNEQGQFQLVDVVDSMDPLTKYTRQLLSPDSIPARVREAFRLAAEERPGATHLELPEDVARADCQRSVIAPSATERPEAGQTTLERAANKIAEAKAPLLVIGAAANRSHACLTLKKFVDTHRIPFITTQMGKGIIDETDRGFVGNAALSEGDLPHEAIEKTDLIVMVGHSIIEKPPFIMNEEGPDVIHINFNSANVDAVYFPQIEVVGDIAHSIEALRQDLSRRTPAPTWDTATFEEIALRYKESLTAGQDDDRFPLNPQRLVAETRKSMPEESILCLDNGMFKTWFSRNYPAQYPNTILLDNALATMGAGLPSAITAKLEFPNRRVLAVCGDGGLLMNGQELATAVDLDLDLVVMVLRDDAYGMIRSKQKEMGFKEASMTLNNPDLVLYARSFGAHGHSIESAEQLQSQIEDAYQQGGVHVIDVPIDYSDSEELLAQSAQTRKPAHTRHELTNT